MKINYWKEVQLILSGKQVSMNILNSVWTLQVKQEEKIRYKLSMMYAD